jgi:STE24 endopeptidase
MEVLATSNGGSGSVPTFSPTAIQWVGVVATVLFWGLGFGWLSRRYERQADLFGARCVTPPENHCQYPCSVHSDLGAPAQQDGRVCATGAAVFAAALERVAQLNGIPREERSWRHSSIGSRVRFLLSVAADPGRAVRFERGIRRVKAVMLAVAVVGSAGSVYYWSTYIEPTLLGLQAGVR